MSISHLARSYKKSRIRKELPLRQKFARSTTKALNHDKQTSLFGVAIITLLFCTAIVILIFVTPLNDPTVQMRFFIAEVILVLFMFLTAWKDITKYVLVKEELDGRQ